MKPSLRPSLGLSLALVALVLGGCRKNRGGGVAPVGLASIAFETRDEIATGLRGIRALLHLDLSGDGVEDLVLSSVVDKKVQVLVGSPSPGVFSTTALTPLAFPSPPGDLVAADVDKDGDLDLACLFDAEEKLRILTNDGSGGLTETASFATSANPWGLAAADFNGDQRADLALSNGLGEQVFVWMGTSTGFAARSAFHIGANGLAGTIAVGDLNGDGKDDLVAPNTKADSVRVWLAQASGLDPAKSADYATLGKGPVAALIADGDNDGSLDVFAANFDAESFAYLPGDGKGVLGKAENFAVGGKPFHLSAGDVASHDGRPDIVVSYLDRTAVSVLASGVPSGGRVAYAGEVQLSTSGFPIQSRVYDLDGDGNLDIVTGGLNTDRVSWFRGSSSGALGASQTFATGRPTPHFVACADVNDDGFADAIVSDYLDGVVSILAGSQGGALAQAYESSTGAKPGVVTTGDFNGDGKVDFIVSVESGLRFFVNTSSAGNMSFSVHPALSGPPMNAGTGPFQTIVGRFDGDSIDDLIVADYGGDALAFVKGTGIGSGFASAGTKIAVSGGPISLVSGDFNRDGQLDVAVSRFKLGTVSIYAGDGAGGFKLSNDLLAGSNPSYLRKADFDGNGLEDLIVSNLGAQELTVFLAGSANFSTVTHKVGVGPSAMNAVDLNLDGRPDVLVANSVDADFFVLLGDGSGGFSSTIRVPGSYRALSADLGDVNGDSLPDIVVTSLFLDRVGLILNRSK